MAVTPASLLQPEGPLDPSLFPDDAAPPATGAGSVLGRLTTYINRAVTKLAPYSLANPDPATEKWALYLAFSDAHTLAVARPASETDPAGLGGRAYNADQLKALARKAEEYRGDFNEIVGAVPGSIPTHRVSRVTTNNFEW